MNSEMAYQMNADFSKRHEVSPCSSPELKHHFCLGNTDNLRHKVSPKCCPLRRCYTVKCFVQLVSQCFGNIVAGQVARNIS